MRRRARGPVVYLLHASGKLAGHAQHYVGTALDGDVWRRLDQHRAGRGACITAAMVAAGLQLSIVCTWPGSRSAERRIKSLKGAAAFCPICRPELIRRRRVRQVERRARRAAGGARSEHAGVINARDREC